MDVPILVAIISVSGTLLGTVVGGSIVTWGNYFLPEGGSGWNLQQHVA